MRITIKVNLQNATAVFISVIQTHGRLGILWRREQDSAKTATSSIGIEGNVSTLDVASRAKEIFEILPLAMEWQVPNKENTARICLLYTSPSPRDGLLSRMPSSA